MTECQASSLIAEQPGIFIDWRRKERPQLPAYTVQYDVEIRRA